MNELIHGDCMEVMAKYPDKYFELAIVDPPYGINIDKIWGNENQGYKSYDVKGWDSCPPNKEYFTELFRVSKNQIVCGGNYFSEYLPSSMGWVVWDKGQRDFSMADGEMIWTSFNRALRIFTMSRGECVQQNGKSKIHICQKPVKLYKWLLEKYANKGDKILDTHGGSCSSVIACLEYGFEYLAVEKDEDYYNSAMKRINDYKAQTNLFKNVI